MESYTVSELNEAIKVAINAEFKNVSLTVNGEISNLKHSGKHTYLTLKDDNSQINIAFWNTSLNNKHGDNVSINGYVELYTKSGSINVIGKTIKMKGSLPLN